MDPDWRLGMLLPAVPAVIVLVTIYSLPESPRYLLRKVGSEETKKTLQKLRQQESVTEELNTLEEDVEMEKGNDAAPWSVLYTDPSIRKRVLIAVALQWMQQFSGVNAMISHGPKLFEDLGLLPLDGKTVAWAQSFVNIFGVLLGMMVIDRLGRRILLLQSAIVMFISMMAVAILLNMYHGKDDVSDAVGWVIFVFLIIYMIGFQTAFGPIPWLYPSEIFPMDIKEKALSISVFNQFVATGIIFYIVPPMIDNWQGHSLFYFFSAFLFVSIFIIWFFVPETMGVALEDMDSIFGQRQYIKNVENGKKYTEKNTPLEN